MFLNHSRFLPVDRINFWNDLLEAIHSIGPNREIFIEYKRSKEYVQFEEEIPNIGLLNIAQYSSVMNNIDLLLYRGHRNINKRDFNNLIWLPEIFKTEKFKLVPLISAFVSLAPSKFAASRSQLIQEFVSNNFLR